MPNDAVKPKWLDNWNRLDNFNEIGSLFGRDGAGVGFAKQTDEESFTYAFAWPEGDAWATLTGYLNLDEQPNEYVRRVLEDGGFRSDWGNPNYDPIEDFKETAGDGYHIPLMKALLREQLESRYEVANHFPTMNRARAELSTFIQNEGGTALPEDALGTISEPGSGAKAVVDIRHGIEPNGYDITSETRDMASGRDALSATAPDRDAPEQEKGRDSTLK